MNRLDAWSFERRFNQTDIRGIVFIQILEQNNLIQLERTYGGIKCLYPSLTQDQIQTALNAFYGLSLFSRLVFQYKAVKRWKNECKPLGRV